MQPQPIDWLEVIKAVAPYVTAIIAIIASTIAAWMTHRNWLKQFMVEKSHLRRQERVRLLQEIHIKLSDAMRLVAEAQWSHLSSRLFTRLIRENESLPAEQRAGFENMADQSMNEYNELVGKLSGNMPDYSTLPLTSRIYFGKETSKALEKFLASLQKAMILTDDFRKLDEDLYPIFLSGLKKNQDQFLQRLQRTGLERMSSLFSELQQSRTLVIQSMVEYLEKTV
ncbi:MAG: hypothetical protein B6D40_00625 [Anaerolineae bacterium UTCFX3]|jgi:hypothetical protein|nr:MAG: hypothetical protein B6D40_00625 [Anaerolineae bacterium UTCFX3]